MITHLILNNLVLVDSSEITFTPQFNAVTGETGSGKTALIEAIALALGHRADSSLIRKGCERAFVEASFSIANLPALHVLLEGAGISFNPQEDLLIRREIAKEGKNRAFINCHPVPLPFLQTISSHLIDLIDQHSSSALRSAETQRALLDLFGDIAPFLTAFQNAYDKEKQLQATLDNLNELSVKKVREEEMIRFQIQDIEESKPISSADEEELFSRYQRLASSTEIKEKVEIILHGLTEPPSALITTLSRYCKSCESLPALKDTGMLLSDALIALREASHTLQSYTDELSFDPTTYAALEERLSTLSRLKKKYGSTLENVLAYYASLKEKLSHLENLSDEIASCTQQLIAARGITEQSSSILTEKRKEAAMRLQSVLTTHLQELNMAGSQLSIDIQPQVRSQWGNDQISFYLKANTGESPALVREHSSGGELSRLLFAIKVALAEKNNTPTLIFDEIDANVGGTTASIIGEKLSSLGTHRQVICITHFPQVASKADAHFAVHKLEKEGRTLTQITALSKKEREKELIRMIGGEKKLILQI